jgi:hypothetical protein
LAEFFVTLSTWFSVLFGGSFDGCSDAFDKEFWPLVLPLPRDRNLPKKPLLVRGGASLASAPWMEEVPLPCVVPSFVFLSLNLRALNKVRGRFFVLAGTSAVLGSLDFFSLDFLVFVVSLGS